MNVFFALFSFKFRGIADQLFQSFNSSIDVTSFDTLSSCIINWLEECCKPQVSTERGHAHNICHTSIPSLFHVSLSLSDIAWDCSLKFKSRYTKATTTAATNFKQYQLILFQCFVLWLYGINLYIYMQLWKLMCSNNNNYKFYINNS